MSLFRISLRQFSVAILFSIVLSSAAFAEDIENGSDNYSMPDRSNALSAELLGRGGLYSFDYDRMISNSIAIGAGVSYWGVTDFVGDSISLAIIPVYANFYLNPGPNRFYLTAGMDLVVASATDSDGFGDGFGGSATGTGVMAVAGAGYEYRSPTSGFLFRVAPYLFVGAGGVAVFGGISLGYAF
jgi:hypothetical protein